MEKPWQFPTDEELDTFCHEVAREMVAQFAISDDEAIGRINRDWKGRNWIGSEYGWIVYHEPEDEWARDIYYGKSACWWASETDRERWGIGPLVPKPYP